MPTVYGPVKGKPIWTAVARHRFGIFYFDFGHQSERRKR